MIEEYVPLALYPVASASNSLLSQIGVFLALFAAMVQPVPPKPNASDFANDYKIYEQELEDDESDQVPDDVDDDRTHADEDAILREQVLVRAPPDGATARNQRNAGTE